MDIYREITDRIITQMEQGIIPWRKPWIARGQAISYATGKPYSLLNQMLLGRPGEYATFRQIQQEGGYVRKGEKASMVVFWKVMEQGIRKRANRKPFPFCAITACSTSTSAKGWGRDTPNPCRRRPAQTKTPKPS